MTHTLMPLIQQHARVLRAVSTTPCLDVEIFLTEILSCTRANLWTRSHTLGPDTHQKLNGWVERRRREEPVAYIIGHQAFWTIDVRVTPDVLIPRPETEHLVEWILAHHVKQAPVLVLELGTGSGAIALALSKECPHWLIHAVDISTAALQVAETNAKQLQCSNIQFIHSSWFEHSAMTHPYDVIVSNPPYLDAQDPHLKHLHFEPKLALVSDHNGFCALKHIIHCSKKHLKKTGYLILEHGFSQQEDLIQELRMAQFSEITAHRDHGNHPRWLTARHTS